MASAEEELFMVNKAETEEDFDPGLVLGTGVDKLKREKDKRPIWSDEEVSALLNIMIEERILSLLDGKKYKKRDIFKLVQEHLEKKGFPRTLIQILNKWKQLKGLYAETKRGNSKSGGRRTKCTYFSSLDELLGARPTKTLEGIDSSSTAVPSNFTIAGETRQHQGSVSSVLQRRAELLNTRPYRKSSEKQTWEEVGNAKLELIKIQTEIAAEELRRAKRKTEQEEEEHQLKLRLMREMHVARMRLMRDDE